MKVKLIIISIILLLVMVFVSGCIPVLEKLGLVNPTNEEQLSPEKASPDGLVKVLIGFKEKPGAAQQALVKGVGGQIKYTYHIVDAIAASIPEKAIVALQNNPNVTHVELDIKVYALDTELSDSWGVERIGAGIVHDGGNMGTGIEVAIIDSGIDYTHLDLNDNYAGGYDFVNDDDDPMDDAGHGTHVAGTVAAEDDGVGVVGVAPEASLYALKALDSNGSGYVSDVVAAIEWATDPNGDEDTSDRLDIINMSLGGGANSTLENTCSSAEDKGLLLVASAGNSGNPPGRGDNVGYPAAYESVIAVAATDQNDERARWSSTGPAVELAAPGVDIYSTYKDGGYATYSGTSMAAPHVAGTAALVWAVNIGWENDDVRNQLEITADDLGDSSLYGNGLVDADEAAGAEIPPLDAGTIAGNVTDASDLKAIPGATVIVEDPNLFATTDSVGNYTIDNVPVGGHTVTASATGYIKESLPVEVLKDQTTTDVDFALTPKPTPSNTMHVSQIDMSSNEVTAGPNKFYTAIATVKIVDTDDDDVAVEGATVYGHWSGATSDSDSGVTDASGQVSLVSNKVKNPPDGTTFTFTVDDVVKDGWTYDSPSDEPSENIIY